VPWLKVVGGITWEAAVAGGMTKFLIWDAAKLAVAAGIFPVAWWIIGRRPEDR
jgi:biotin transport system substrate-specific component